MIEGSHAVAEAVRLSRPQVISAYPITPQTHIVEALADMVANCKLDAEYITVENELSALSACVGASAAGSRMYSATTSQGLALMFEVCFNAAGMRLPIIMSIANRASGCPALDMERPAGLDVTQGRGLAPVLRRGQSGSDRPPLYCVQGGGRPLDTLPAVRLLRRIYSSHTYEPVDMLTQGDVDCFLPKFTPYERLDAADPISFGMYATPEYYLEFKYEMDKALKSARQVIGQAGKEFGTLFGRDYSALIEGYRLEDAETAIVTMVPCAEPVRDGIDEMRAEGKKVGLLKIRVSGRSRRKRSQKCSPMSPVWQCLTRTSP